MQKTPDWPHFQRLRGIHQLGLTYLVYPGAVHTRFEHSLGVFENAILVLEQITGQQGDRRFRAMVKDEELVATSLVALFHDIGHYPFGHDFRLSGEYPMHESRSLELVKSEDVRKMVTEEINKDVYEVLIELMQYIVDCKIRRRCAGGKKYPGHFRVLRSIVSSAVDVDKLEYINRDSIHAGVPYGRIVDQDRFLTSFRVWWNNLNEPQLLLSDKGRACAEALVFARYLMFSEVYWNHGVRAYAAMLSAAIDQIDTDEVNRHLWDTDADFLRWLSEHDKTKWLDDLIKNRTPYRRAFILQKRGHIGEEIDRINKELFNFLENAIKDKALYTEVCNVALEALGIQDAKEHEIVLDIPKGLTDVGGVQVLPEGQEIPASVSPIFDAIGENFDAYARKARIFIHPKFMVDKSITESTDSVRRELIRLFNID